MKAHSIPRHSSFINLLGLIWLLACQAILRYIQVSEPGPDAISPWCFCTEGQNYQHLYYITKLLFKVAFPIYFPINDVRRSIISPFYFLTLGMIQHACSCFHKPQSYIFLFFVLFCICVVFHSKKMCKHCSLAAV